MTEALFCDPVCLEPACFAGREVGVLFAEAFFRIGFFIGWFRPSSASIVGGTEAVKFAASLSKISEIDWCCVYACPANHDVFPFRMRSGHTFQAMDDRRLQIRRIRNVTCIFFLQLSDPDRDCFGWRAYVIIGSAFNVITRYEGSPAGFPMGRTNAPAAARVSSEDPVGSDRDRCVSRRDTKENAVAAEPACTSSFNSMWLLISGARNILLTCPGWC